MFSISSIGKLQKITKLFTLFYTLSLTEGHFATVFPGEVKNTGYVFLILLHFDTFVNRFLIKIFLSLPAWAGGQFATESGRYRTHHDCAR